MKPITAFFCGFFLLAITAHAQLKGDLVLTPVNPGPYEEVKVTLTSYDFDVDNSTVTWSLNGKTVSSGPGLKEITVMTGAVGAATTVSAKAAAPSGQTFTATMSIAPASVDLTWETFESYVPPFYEGRSLPGEGATVRVSATPHISSGGKVLAPNDVSFAWYKNEEFLGSLSGRGRQTADITLEYLTDITSVKVIARTPDGATATRSIDIMPTQPVGIFYLYDPVLGPDYAHPIMRRFETTKEFTLKFVPYFFSLNGAAGRDVTFSWSLDGLPITTENDTTVTLRPKENSYGSRTLTVALEHGSRILQTLEENLNIVFDTR